MNLTLRIWLISLIIQPICFGPLGLIVIPIELIGSLPGIIIFGLIVQMLLKSDLPFSTTFLLLFIIAGVLGFLSSYLFLSYEEMGVGPNSNEKLLLSLPATIATTFAVAFSYKTAKRLFQPDKIVTDNDGLL